MPKHLQIFQIDAFAGEVFAGNPAAVCPLEAWLPDELLQAIALENNLAETAFFIPDGEAFQLRWFTPKYEVDLCGHATLAAALVIFEEMNYPEETIVFHTRSGPLSVTRRKELLEMDFPALAMLPCPAPPMHLIMGLSILPASIYQVDSDPNYYAVYRQETEVADLQPELSILEKLHPYGVVVSAPGVESDFVSRYFAPSYGIPEDPATGSIHCALTPFWAERLDKNELFARQISPRGGELFCELRGERVSIAGRAVKYLQGEIFLE